MSAVAARWLIQVATAALVILTVVAVVGITLGVLLATRGHTLAGIITLGASILGWPASALPSLAGIAVGRYIEDRTR